MTSAVSHSLHSSEIRCKPQHRITSLLHHTVIMLNHVIQVLAGPEHGLNDQEMIEMAAFEEFRLLRRKLGHAEDYP